MSTPFATCGSCKRPIAWGARYYVCSVSTCNRARFQLAFCSVACWDAHSPVMNHRNAWAEERRAPLTPPADHPTSAPAAARTTTVGALHGRPPEPEAPARRLVRGPEEEADPDDILIVASKLKAYIKEKADFNTSADTLEALSDLVRRATDEAIRRARAEGRRTVKGRDFEP